MTYAIYDVAATLAVPAAAGWLAVDPRLRPLLGRFRPHTSHVTGRPLWFQACSVGEMTVAASLVQHARERWPAVSTLVTASTVAGRKRAGELLPDTPFAWFPFDHRSAVRGFLRRTQPRMLVLVETEIWPNVIRHARLHRVPVVVANGRISDRHYPRYLRFQRFLRPVWEQLAGVCVQNQTYAERFETLGVPPARIRVSGSTKFDGLKTNVEAETLEAIRHETGLDRSGPIVVFGSTRPGDEALAAACWRTLRIPFPSLRIVIAPRHVERAREIFPLFDGPVGLRSKSGIRDRDARVLIVDSLGELVAFYALADIAVVGGSFYPGVNGHNPLEPAAVGTPVVFGPHMRNFMDPADALVRHGGAVQLDGPEALAATLARLLKAPSEAADIARGAREAIAEHQGATGRTIDYMAEILEASGERDASLAS